MQSDGVYVCLFDGGGEGEVGREEWEGKGKGGGLIYDVQRLPRVSQTSER